MDRAIQYLTLLRIHQWHKNLFVFLGFFVLGNYGNYDLLAKAIIMTAVFCLASSSVYIFNDYHDRESDRKHPTKKNRPLANGAISISAALFLALSFCFASLIISFYVNIAALIVISIYLVNNLTYSLFLKKYPIIDVFQIGLGFMLRIFAGTEGIGIYISEWMLLTGFMISILIGFSKRYAELSNNAAPQNHREVLREYSLETLNSFMIIMAAATIITYSLYTLSPRSIELHGTTNLIYTTPFVMFGIFRFLYLVQFQQSGDDPSSQIFKDKQLVITVILWALTYGILIR
ncbi:MAG: decaprenyl-phosphate phosphoribosyltransferase [Nitrospirae bacterium]|nr:decaprenyl-phosphate phosphoribosyltransferase [Nitrospirota bacterium]